MSDDLELTPEQRAWGREVVAKSEAIRDAMKRVAPDVDGSLLLDIAVDTGDFWEIAENHRRRVEEIVSLSGPADRERLSRLLTDLWYRDITAHFAYHLKSMRTRMPRLIDLLDNQQEADQ